jgi:hypothetical protein
MKPQHRFLVVIAIACLMVIASNAWGAIPRTISYQGKATDASGNPVPDATYIARFTILDAPTGGTALWVEMGVSVATAGGLFSYLLGTTNPIPDSLFAKYDSLFLQVMFNGQTMSPRTPLVSTGYAFRVNSVDGALGGTITGTLIIDGTGTYWINPDATGFNSVMFPTDGINAREIYDEPGIAAATRTSYKLFETTTGSDVLTVSLTTPADGYIFVEAKFQCSATGLGQSLGWIQIDEASGGTYTDPYYSTFGQDTCFSQGSAVSMPGYVSRVYYKSAGSHTFRLEGGEYSGNCGSCVPQVWHIILVATFFPTAYGTVSSMVSGSEAGQFEGAKPVQVDGQTMYEVDLRDLELRAAKAEAAAERARADAEKAKADLLRAKRDASAGTNNQTNTAIGK